MYKNIEKQAGLKLKNLAGCQKGQVVSKHWYKMIMLA